MESVQQVLDGLCNAAGEDGARSEVAYLCSVLAGYATDGTLDEALCAASTDAQLTDHLRVILSIPDRVANALEGSDVPAALQPEVFHGARCRHCFRRLEGAEAAAETAAPDAVPPAVAQACAVANLLAARGHAAVVARRVFKSMLRVRESTAEGGERAARLFASFFQGLTEASLERVLEALLRCLSPTAQLTQRPLPNEGTWRGPAVKGVLQAALARLLGPGDAPVPRVLTTRLLLQKALPAAAIEACVECLAAARTASPAFGDAARRLLRRWADPSFALLATEPEHAALGAALLHCLRRLAPDELAQWDGTGPLLRGVQLRLASPEAPLRRWAAIIGRQYSFMVAAPEPLDFDEFPKALERFLHGGDEQGRAPPPPAPPTPPHALPPHRRRPPKPPAEEDDPDAPFFPEHDAEEGEAGEAGAAEAGEAAAPSGEEDSESDLSSLEPYDLKDDAEAGPAAGRPRHLREALEALAASKEDVDALEAALRAVEGLVVAEPDDLESVSAPLARVLLHLQDAYSIDQFSELRMGALVALAAHSPATVVPLLSGQFYLENYTLGQRSDVLQVLALAAQALARPAPEDGGPTTASAAAAMSGRRPYPPPEPLDPHTLAAQQRRQDRLEARTRRWGRRRRPPPPAARNRFLAHAPLFALNLMRDYDRKHFRIAADEDCFAVGKLLHTLGVFVECCGRATHVLRHVLIPVLEFGFALRSHPQKYVRAQLLGLALKGWAACPPELHGDVAPLVEQWGEWLADLAQTSDEMDIRLLAQSVLSALRHLVWQVAPPLVVPL